MAAAMRYGRRNTQKLRIKQQKELEERRLMAFRQGRELPPDPATGRDRYAPGTTITTRDGRRRYVTLPNGAWKRTQ